MPRRVLNRPMFARGGYKLPGYGGGGFKPKVKWNPSDIVEEYGIKGLEWLQRKIYGGSWVPESWSKKLLDKSKKDLEIKYGTGAADNIFSDVETRAEIDPSKLDTEGYTRNHLVDALKWGNEGWVNPLGYIPKVWPVPLRPLRKEETMTGWGKEILSKGAKALTAGAAIGGGKELLKSDEIKAQEKIIKELDSKNIDLGWAEDQSLPTKTIENEVLENPLGEGNQELADALGVDQEIISGTGNLLLTDELEQEAGTETKTAVTDGSENVTDFNTPINKVEAESGNVVDLKSIRKEYEKDKDKTTDQTEIDDKQDLISETIRKNNEAISQGTMELEPSDLSEIQQYIGFLQAVMGKRDPMMSASLLLQLGTALMNAKTTRGGIEGFLQAAGQAGAEIAPQLMKLGAMNEERKQALATAALQLYMDKVKQSRPSGAPYTVAEIDWKQNEAGHWYADGVKSVKQMQLNSDPFRSVMAEDNAFFEQFNRPKYSFISPASGQDVPVLLGALGKQETGALITEAGQAAFQQTGGYMNDILDISIPFLSQLMDNEHLMGASGELAEKGLGLKSTFEDVLALVRGENPEWEDNMAKSFFSLGDSFENTGLTSKTANDAIDMGGQSIPVFIDWYNELGMNKDGMESHSRDRRLLGLDAAGNPIGVRSFMVKEGFDKFFNADVIGSMDLIARTVGTGYARSRQPTGRMLADVLQGSLKDAKYTGFGANQKSSRWAVLSAHTSIISEMYEKIDTAYRNAGITNDPDVANPQSLKYVSGMRYIKELDGGEIGNTGRHMWNIKGFKEFANKYYTLKESINPDLKDIPFYTFNDWKNDTNVQLQNTIIEKNKEESNVKDSIIDTFDKGFDFIMGNQ